MSAHPSGPVGEPSSTWAAEPACGQRVSATQDDPADDWLCAWCLARVAQEKHRFPFDGKDEFAFSNPAGVHFEIITFAQTFGCRQLGVPTFEHTWFPGFAWAYCQCEQCGQHLGWYYCGAQTFVGLIKSRIVKGVCIRN